MTQNEEKESYQTLKDGIRTEAKLEIKLGSVFGNEIHMYRKSLATQVCASYMTQLQKGKYHCRRL